MPRNTVDPRHLSGSDWCHPKNLAHIESWVRAGWYGAKLAEKMGISIDTLRRWRSMYPPINEAMNAAEEDAVRTVEEALYKRALGYEVDYEEVIEGPSGTTVKTGAKHIPGEVQAMTFFLKNRAQDRWNDRRIFSAEISMQVIEKQAQDILEVLDTAILALGLTPDQRMRLPKLIQQAIEAKGLDTGYRDKDSLLELERAHEEAIVDAVVLEEIDEHDLI